MSANRFDELFAKPVSLLIRCALALPICGNLWGQEPPLPGGTDANAATSCDTCHTCNQPTTDDPCLRACSREAAMNHVLQARHGPGVVILDELENLYLPVPFDHQGHAKMAGMTSGCTVCHHYTPEGLEHPACNSCHEVSPAQADMRKPGLKGAYHRQCLNCHKEWSHETSCNICHIPKTGTSAPALENLPPSVDDIVGRMHPPIPEPKVRTYQTSHPDPVGSTVWFRHDEHVHRFGFACADCHHEDNCLRCHEERGTSTPSVRTLDQHHSPCSSCHVSDDANRCDHCHRPTGSREPAPFDHVSTGWALSKYHDQRSCRDCHDTVPFKSLNRSCDACHAAWSPKTFDHAITGQELNKDHAEFDCVECHADRDFAVPPTCDECHDEDEGIRFPDQRPGPVH